MDFIQHVVNDISTDRWLYSQYRIPLNTDVWFIGKNIAKKLNAIEEHRNDYMLLKWNHIYIKITWEDFPDHRYTVVVFERLSPSDLRTQ